MCVCVRALTALGDGSRRGQVSVLSVHVVGAAAGVVTQPDTKVLHLQGSLLMDLQQSTTAGRQQSLQTRQLPLLSRRRHWPHSPHIVLFGSRNTLTGQTDPR